MARRRAVKAPLGFMPLTALLLLAGCGGAPPATPASTGLAGQTAGLGGSPANAGSVEVAASTLQATKLDDDASLAALEGIRFTPAGTEAAARLLGSGATGDVLWAATYVYASAGADPTPLRSLAGSSTASLTIRTMAGAGLLAAGDVAGFGPLLLALAASEQMDGAAPAGYLWEFAADVLERYTHTGFGPGLAATDPERATIVAHWQTWLDTNRDRLRFDATTHLWVVS
jgi:hypothetical protein